MPQPTCDAGYYLNDDDECEICPVGFYCQNSEKIACPDPYTHQPSRLPANVTNPQLERFKPKRTGCTDISECLIEAFVGFDQGACYIDADFDAETQRYERPDRANYQCLWYMAKPGYYLSEHNSETSLYYREIAQCLPGNYCPGETTLPSSGQILGETYGMYPCAAGSYSTSAGATACIPCGAGNWAGAGATACNACPVDTTTIGYGPGADEAGDCGRIMHVGNDVLYLRSDRQTSPSMNVEINGQVFYGNMSPDLGRGKMRINVGGQIYSVYDDSM